MYSALSTIMLDTKKLWRDTLESIKVSVSPAIFSTWFSQTFLAKIEKQGTRFVIEVGCASPFIKTTIESRYFGMLQDSLVKSLEASCDLTFVVRQNPDKKTFEHTLDTPLFQKDDKEEINEAFLRTHIRPGFTFENFAVSSSNQMAHAAAEAVSNTPGSAYNPLFIWGGVGVGKTHLMLAIGYCLLAENPLAKILFVSGEEFTNGIVEGIRNKTTTAFRDKYRRLDTLLIDDIQFIAGKDAVQEEFFHTFNAIVQNQGQIVLTSDKPPVEMVLLEDRLRSRFEGGLTIDIQEPNLELRAAILNIKASARGLTLPMDVAQLIAAHTMSTRALEGVLVKLMNRQQVRNEPITMEMAQGVLGSQTDTEKPKKYIPPQEIIEAVAVHFGLKVAHIKGKRRTKDLATARHIAMYIMRIDFEIPLAEVGKIFGGRDHTTVMHAVEKINELTHTSEWWRREVAASRKQLWG